MRWQREDHSQIEANVALEELGHPDELVAAIANRGAVYSIDDFIVVPGLARSGF